MKQKIKIAIFHCGFVYSGGGERVVFEQARGLRLRGYEVEIFAPTLDKDKCYPGEIKRLKIKTFLPQLPSFIPARFALLTVLSSLLAPLFSFRFREFDIFIGANQPGAWIAYCISKILNKPYLTYANQPNRLLYPRQIDKEVKWQNLREFYFVAKLIQKIRFFVSWADRTSFTSARIMFENGDYIGPILNKIYQNRTMPCPAGIYPPAFKDLRLNLNLNFGGKLKVKNIKNQIIEIGRPYILLTNRHEPQKKFEYGIEATKMVLEKFPDVRLVISGAFTPYTPKILNLAKKLGILQRIVFVDEVSDKTLRKLYQEAAVYIYTAPEEDFGLGIIEAMSFGVPVVAWNCAGPKYTVIDGRTGFLAKPYKIEDFAQKINSILIDHKKRNEMGKYAWEHVKNHFSWNKHIDIIEKEILRCLE